MDARKRMDGWMDAMRKGEMDARMIDGWMDWMMDGWNEKERDGRMDGMKKE